MSSEYVNEDKINKKKGISKSSHYHHLIMILLRIRAPQDLNLNDYKNFIQDSGVI